ncbi:MAG TPA: type II toxin-antitoxin system ParD family antitoxin [Patescibacteria group bacterium]|nr:type II toxin-antitoxin system ParD family antitoxin [Patescibacteria group bacterium]
MSTLSIPLTPQLETFIDEQVRLGRAANKADVVRKALRLLLEEEAVAQVLRAEKEPTLSGNLDELVKKIT